MLVIIADRILLFVCIGPLRPSEVDLSILAGAQSSKKTGALFTPHGAPASIAGRATSPAGKELSELSMAADVRESNRCVLCSVASLFFVGAIVEYRASAMD